MNFVLPITLVQVGEVFGSMFIQYLFDINQPMNLKIENEFDS